MARPEAPGLWQSPKESGFSRADLWAFAGMVAVEHGIHLNNLACHKLDLDDAHGSLFPRKCLSKFSLGGDPFLKNRPQNLVKLESRGF